MKKLINDPDDVVRESLEGLALIQPGLGLLQGRLIAVRSDAVVTDANRASVPVAVISGGGAGHEPAHAGYVAAGMLTAAVSGDVFASPSVEAVLDGIRAVTGDAGCLLVVKSYTGDRLNFGMAAEVARAEGLDVHMVVVADDVALADDDTNAGRRGLAGTVLVHKVAGALAAQGATLDEIERAAQGVIAEVGTMGVGLTPCIVPASGEPGFELGEGEMELGLGIHGEPGVERTSLAPADEVARTLVDRIVADRGLSKGSRVVALVGSTGGTPPMELAIMARAVATEVARHGLDLQRLWAGLVMTSLEMAGASVTLLPVDDDRLALLDAPTASLSWPGGTGAGCDEGGAVPSFEDIPVPAPAGDETDAGTPDERVRRAIDAACEALLAARDDLDAADRHVGDGDLGSALARGAKAWTQDPVDGSAEHLLRHLSMLARRDIGGTSGPLYGMLLLRAAESLAGAPDNSGRDASSSSGSQADWAAAFRAGVDGVRELGGAEPGDGTMVDALAPAADAADQGWDAVIDAATHGAAATVAGTSTKGRASYLGDRAQGYEDPGATAVVFWLTAVRDAL